MARYAYEDDPDSESRLPSPKTVVAGLLALAALGFAAYRYERPVTNDPPGNLAETYAYLAPFSTLYAVKSGWVAEVPTTWAGVTDSATAKSTCTTLLRDLKANKGDTITILAQGGRNVTECRAS